MTIYITDTETNEYIREEQAFICPKTKEPLLPAGGYTDAPPKATKGKAIIRGKAGWELVDDYRGKTIYSTSDKTEDTQKGLGAIKDGFTLLKPSGYEEWGEWDGEKWAENKELKKEALKIQKRAERDQALNSTQWLVDRHFEEIEKTLSEAQYQDLLQYRQGLRDLPSDPKFPDVEIPVYKGGK